MACSLWALRTSGFWFLLAMISAREAPVIALWNFTARRVRFFATSSCLIKKKKHICKPNKPLHGLHQINLTNWGFSAEVCRRVWRLAKGGGVNKDVKDQYYDLLLFCGCRCSASDAAEAAKRSPATTRNTDQHCAHYSPTAKPICKWWATQYRDQTKMSIQWCLKYEWI